MYLSLTFLLLTGSALKANCQLKKDTEIRIINKPYKTVCVATGIRLSITGGNDDKIEVKSSTQDYRNKIKTIVINDTLKIFLSYKDDPKWKGLVNSKETFNVQISAGTLRAIGASEASSVVIKDRLSVDELSLKLITGAQLNGNINCKKLTVEIQDGSNLVLKGAAVNANFYLKGGSFFNGKNLIVESCNAKVYSGSESNLFVTKKLDIIAKNDARVYLTGNPSEISKEIEKSVLKSNVK